MARDPDEEDSDEESLSWGDEKDATHVESRVTAAPAADAAVLDDEPTDARVATPSTTGGDLAEAFPDAQTVDSDAEDESDEAPNQLSSAALVGLGFIGGIYLLYAVGWLVSVLRIGVPFDDDQILQRLMYQLGEVLAVAAAPLWFAVTLVLSRPAIIRRGLIWLVIGLVVLAPWPFILGV